MATRCQDEKSQGCLEPSHGKEVLTQTASISGPTEVTEYLHLRCKAGPVLFRDLTGDASHFGRGTNKTLAILDRIPCLHTSYLNLSLPGLTCLASHPSASDLRLCPRAYPPENHGRSCEAQHLPHLARFARENTTPTSSSPWPAEDRCPQCQLDTIGCGNVLLEVPDTEAIPTT